MLKTKYLLTCELLFSLCVLEIRPSTGFSPASMLFDSKANNSVRYATEQTEYVLEYKTDTQFTQYTIKLQDPVVLRGGVKIYVNLNDTERLVPIYEAGMMVLDATGQLHEPRELAIRTPTDLISHEIKDDAVVFQFEDRIEGATLQKGYRYSIQGKTLIVQATSAFTNTPEAYYAGFDIGRSRLTENPIIYHLPSVPIPIVQSNQNFFYTSYVDPFLSSTGRYEVNQDVTSLRSVEATNTPAWLVANASGIRPELDVTMYLTVSDKLIDVVPVIASAAKSVAESARPPVVLDLHDWPLAMKSRQSLEAIRRWEAPASGRVRLKGAYSLYDGDMALCEVYFLDHATQESHLLYSRTLDPINKVATGMEGYIPIEKGDSIEFVCSGPAVMTEGAILTEIELEFGGDVYHTYDDFSNVQGHQQWYYEQRMGGERTLMIWNPTTNRWESPFTRSFQTEEFIVSRVGDFGDAFAAAKSFFEELRLLGLTDLAFLVRGWADRARFTYPSTVNDDSVWGSAAHLAELAQHENESGNRIVDVLPSPTIERYIQQTKATFVKNSTNATSDQFSIQLRSMIEQHISADTQKMSTHSIWFESPASVVSLKGDGSFYEMFFIDNPSSKTAFQWGDQFARDLRTGLNKPMYLHWKDPLFRFDMFLSSMVDGIASPAWILSNAKTIVDEEARMARRFYPRVGLGPYSEFFQLSHDRLHLNPSLYPLDRYLTTSLIYGRIPYISGKVWAPRFDGHAVRRYLMDSICMTQPVSRDYLDPRVTVDHIDYSIDGEQEIPTEMVLSQNKASEANRIHITYSNGLHLFANLDSTPWKLERADLPKVTIQSNGFFAINRSSGLFALIGEQEGNTIRVCQTSETLYLASRENRLIGYGGLSTDGTIHRWSNEFASHPNMACLGTKDVYRSEKLIPLFRSNARMDCSIVWASFNQIDLRIFEAEPGPNLLEFFDLPSEWLKNDGKGIQVTRSPERPATVEKQPFWSVIESSGQAGLRLTDVKEGERYTILFK